MWLSLYQITSKNNVKVSQTKTTFTLNLAVARLLSQKFITQKKRGIAELATKQPRKCYTGTKGFSKEESKEVLKEV